jgi:type II secretory pathway pseudopilin PulG
MWENAGGSTEMRKAFTMIEVVFIISIVGILSAVALPKLLASRDDAKGVRLVHDLSVCITEAGTHYMMEGSFGNTTQPGATQTQSCERADKCFDFTENDSNGTLTVSNDSNATSKDCIEAQRIANQNYLSTTHIINF